MSSVVGGLETIWETLTNLPSLIWESIKGGFSSVTGWLSDIWSSILNLPTLILDGIKSIFVPDMDYIESSFTSFRNEMKTKLGFNTDFFDTLFDDERPVTDVYAEYNISGVGKFNFKFLDTQFLYDGVTYFRPFIRGFIVLLMAFFNVRMVLSFIRQDAGLAVGKGGDIQAGKKGGRYD